MNPQSWTPQFLIQNKDLCAKQLADETFWDSVPLVNYIDLHEFKDNSLVRFRGMIQDMYNPEYYFEKYEVENEETKQRTIKCGKYRDTTDLAANEVIQFNSNRNETCERHTMVVITLPGLNDWVHNIENEKNNSLKPVNSEDISPNKPLKRSIENEEMETENINIDSESPAETKSDHKRICTKHENTNTNVVSREHILNFPLSERSGKCCHLKVYEDADSFKLNDMVDVIGFLSVDPILTEVNYHNNDHDNEMEIQTHNPPPSLVPRIHCVAYKKLGYYNPLLKNMSLDDETAMNLLTNKLNLILPQLLFGDKLAADYLVCHLISSVYLRKDLMAIGKFSLNISNIPAQKHPNYGEQLYDFLQLLLPKSHYLPMTLENMNELAFTPKKDYECNRLTSGLLQLSSGTHLILDETKLQPGQLNSSGCQGIAALASTIKNQKVNYDFNYYQMEFDCDIPVLTISEGTSLLPSDYHIPLQPDQHCVDTFPEIIEASKHFLTPELLDNLRVYLTQARSANYNISDGVLEFVQEEFVKLRQSNNITGDDLHNLLVVARLVSLSRGKNSLDQECWLEACKMEAERKKRVANRPRRQ